MIVVGFESELSYRDPLILNSSPVTPKEARGLMTRWVDQHPEGMASMRTLAEFAEWKGVRFRLPPDEISYDHDTVIFWLIKRGF